MSEITRADLQKLTDAQMAAFGTLEISLANIRALVDLLLALETANIAERFDMPVNDVQQNLSPLLEKFLKDAHDGTLATHKLLKDLKQKRRQGGS